MALMLSPPIFFSKQSLLIAHAININHLCLFVNKNLITFDIFPDYLSMSDFLARVRDEMNYQNLTQKELSEKTGISINTIRGWFSKNLTPDVVSAVKVAQVLNVSVEYLVTGENPVDNSQALRDKIQEAVRVLTS